MKLKRIIIVDDHKIVNAGLNAMLSEETTFDVVQSFFDAETAIDYLRNNKVDLVLMDVNLPGMNGIESSKIILNKFHCAVVILSMRYEHDVILSAVEAGVNGFITKDTNKKELINAIKLVLDGAKYFSPEVANSIVEGIATKVEESKNPYLNLLTSREQEILKLIIAGVSTKQVAFELNLSTRTVDTHRASIMKKLNVKNTAMMVSVALKQGIVKTRKDQSLHMGESSIENFV